MRMPTIFFIVSSIWAGASPPHRSLHLIEALGNLRHRIAYTADGWLSELSAFKENQLHGPSLTFLAGGRPESESFYLEGQLHGARRRHRRDGSPRDLQHFDHGILEGFYAEFHENGRPKWKGYFRQGKKIGIWILCDESGQVVAIRRYPTPPLRMVWE